MDKEELARESVAQADRDAAADYLDTCGWDWGACGDIREGRVEHPVVQAFARHRLAALSPAGEEVTAGRDYWQAKYNPDMTEREKKELAREMCGDVSMRAPVQGFTGGIPWEMHMRAYEVYAKKWSPQVALIDLFGRGCRGGFSTGELDDLIPGWRDQLSERTALLTKIASLEAAQDTPTTEVRAEGEVERLREALGGLLKWADNVSVAHDLGPQKAVEDARVSLVKGGAS